jgi:GH15 family glucan-1,4-alpha-glucosidase
VAEPIVAELSAADGHDRGPRNVARTLPGAVGFRTPERTDAYASIADYAVLGDGRTVALVALDGTVDWLALPDVSSPSVFGALLDADRGGSFAFRPAEPFEAVRAYRDGTNVLETTFRTASGTVRVTDAMVLTDVADLAPLRELFRRVDCLAGDVELEWTVEPRFDYGRKAARWETSRRAVPVAQAGGTAIAVSAWGAGAPTADGSALTGRFRVAAGESAVVDLTAAHGAPLVLPRRDEAEWRLRRTAGFWSEWGSRMTYDGPWREEVRRSLLVLKLLVFAPSGAVVAAPTTSLPEAVGGTRNWDYRYAWIRDAAFALDALMRLGYEDETHAFLWWVMHATRRTQPELGVLYDVDGRRRSGEQELSHLSGYRGSAPVRVGNAAADQVQLDVYGSFLSSVWLYCHHGHRRRLDGDTAKEIAEIADHVAKVWRRPDSSIWEVRGETSDFIHSKAMCCIALERAVALAEDGVIPGRNVGRWRAEAEAVRAFVEEHGWDDGLRSYVRATTIRELDAALLTLPIFGWAEPGDERMRATIDAVRRGLSDGPLVYRYRGADRLESGGDEGCFLTCSFWLADALARTGRADDAAALMDDLVGYANDVGLYSEEVAPSGELLGNFPQALTHLALANAAVSIEEARR